jgi:hypothetical protein
LYNFQDGAACDGKNPTGLTMDSSGNLYGSSTTDALRACANPGWSAFQLVHNGNNYIFLLLRNGGVCGPQSPLTLDAAGNLYGTTECDGEFEDGDVFELIAAQSWRYYSIHSFNGSDGLAAGLSGVTFGPDGSMYGTTRLGGSQSHGTVWQIKP